MKSIGRHILVDLWGCAKLTKTSTEEALREAVRALGGKLLAIEVCKFSPHGITGIAVLAESHISIHTWPECSYVALDVFTCGDLNPYLAVEPIKKLCKPKDTQCVELKRGVTIS